MQFLDALPYSRVQRDALMNMLTTGEESFSRQFVGAASSGLGNQRLTLTYWTARKTETISQIRTITGTSGAGATPTLCRIGIYSIDSSGAGTLVASTANDTSLWATSNTAYTKAFASSWTKTAWQRYATAFLCVSGAGMPNFLSSVFDNGSVGGRAELAQAPRMAGYLGSQSDLPATFADASLTSWAPCYYSVVLP